MADISSGTSGAWFPRTRRNFSLSNIEQDIWDWSANRRAAQEDARAQAAIQSPVQRQITSDSPTYGINPEKSPGEFIAALVQEAKGAQAADPRLVSPHPLRRLKTDERMQTDAQRKYFFDNMLAAYPVGADGSAHPMWQGMPEQMQVDLDAYAKDRDGYRSQTTDPQEYAGVMGSGSAVGDTMAWSHAFPRMLYGVGDMVANAVDPAQQGGAEDFMHALNTATAPGQAMAASLGYASDPQAGHSAWSDARQHRQQADAQEGFYQSFEPNPYGPTLQDADRYGRLTEELNAASRGGGKEYYERRGLPEGASKLLGALTDDIYNPFLDIPGITAASQARKFLPVARAAAFEVGPGLGMAGAEEGLSLLERLSKYQRGAQ